MKEKYEIIITSYNPGYESFKKITNCLMQKIPISDKDVRVTRVAKGLTKMLGWSKIKLIIEKIE